MTSTFVHGLGGRFASQPEWFTIFTPLGIRFLDAASELPVSDGLDVAAWPAGRPEARRRATLSGAGVYAFHGLPGMRDVEYPERRVAPASPPVVRRYTVSLRDVVGRFSPVAFGVDLPYQGIFPTQTIDAQGEPLLGLHLFSAPTRRLGSSLAAVRAQLVGPQGEPAANALLEVSTPDGRLRYGIADEFGGVAAVFPFPLSQHSGGLSPASPPAVGMLQGWPLTVRVLYSPTTLQPVAGAAVPDLRSVLSQAPAMLMPNGTPVQELSVMLSYGREMALRSGAESHLVIAAGSPP